MYIRCFFIFFFICSLFFFSSCTPSKRDEVIVKKGSIHKDYKKKFKGTPDYIAESKLKNNWDLIIKQTGLFPASKKTKIKEMKLAANFIAQRICSENRLPVGKSNFIAGKFIVYAEIEGTFVCGKGSTTTVVEYLFPHAREFSNCKQAKTNNDLAVLVANGNYSRQSSIPNIIPAYANLESMEDYVSRCLGIKTENIFILKDATLSQMRVYFGKESNHVGRIYNNITDSNQNIFVYYVGHGAPGENPPLGDGENYLIPVDANQYSIMNSSYKTQLLYDNLSQLPVSKITVIIDACFSGKNNDDINFLSYNASPIELFLEDEVPNKNNNLTIISAGASNEIASWTENKNHTLLTKYFIKGKGSLEADQNNDKDISDDELLKYLTNNVSNDAKKIYARKQVPQIY